MGPLSLILLDVDHFKSFNDTFGHPAGDDVLRQIASAMSGCCRTTDVPARIGGEEFAVLLPGTGTEGAEVLAERIRQAIEAGPWPLRPVTASFGIATLGPTGPQSLIEAADRALYQAKHTGRNRIVSANVNG
jgi:diguanylate cyclase (GGDEF)-like protein